MLLMMMVWVIVVDCGVWVSDIESYGKIRGD